MSLYSKEEVCMGCEHATFFRCSVCNEVHMCTCSKDVSPIDGSCDEKKAGKATLHLAARSGGFYVPWDGSET
jgi:hypothetical protein